MRFAGHKLSVNLSVSSLGLSLLCLAGAVTPAAAQTTAPYVIPYTMSTYAGPVGTITVGQKCGNYVALNSVGDGCPVSYTVNGNITAGSTSITITSGVVSTGQTINGIGIPNAATITAVTGNVATLSAAATATVNGGYFGIFSTSVGSDPHDIRVDAKGNVFWMDNSSKIVVHKINPYTQVQTIYAGSATQTKVCSTGNGDKYGDGCPANDGAANSGTAVYYTGSLGKARGLATAPNGDVFIADYTNNEINKISASTGLLTLVAGTGTAGFFDGAAATSQLYNPRGVGVDANGNVYIADTGNNLLRLVTPAGVVSTLTATSGATGSGSGGCIKSVASGIPASTATLCAPEDAQVDINGNVFIAEGGNNVVRAIYMGTGTLPGIVAPVKGYIYLIAGYNALNTAATATSYPKDGTTPTIPATFVSMSIRKIALDARGNLYISDSGTTSNNVWFVDAQTGYVRTIAGNYGGVAGAALGCATQTDAVGDGCPGPQSALNTSANSNPGVSADNQGNLYLSDAEGTAAATSRLRKLLSGLNFPVVVAASAGTAASSVTQTIYVHFGPGDSAAAATPFTSSNPDFVIGAPTCKPVNTDTTSDCFVPVTFTPSQPGYDTSTLTIRSTLGAVNTYLFTGTGVAAAVAIDPGTVAAVSTPTALKNAQAVAVDAVGNTYIADTGNNRVLLYTAATAATTVFAGTGAAGFSGDNGPAASATLKSPSALALDTSGSLYIADTGNNVIRKVTAGTITTYAGGAAAVCATATSTRGDGCPATQATLSGPLGVAADNFGQVYVSDTGNNVIRQINAIGTITTLAGGAATVCTANTDTFGDGCSALQSTFNAPAGLAFDATGQALLVADTGNSIVRKISLPNTIATTGTGTGVLAGVVLFNPVNVVAGNGQAGSTIDVNSVATLSSLNGPRAVAVDAAENIYIADTANSAIRLVSTATGLISTIGGIVGSAGTGSVGSAADLQLTAPAGIAVTQTGLLFVSDSGNNRVLTDQRLQITRNFGRTNVGFSSFVQNFSELSIGTAAANLGTPLYAASGSTTLFTLTAPTGNTGCVASEVLAIGQSCILQGQFTPQATGTYSATYTETKAATVGLPPAITLAGVGAILTTTTSTVAQTAPATGNSQFGGSVTFTATVAAACNAAATTCFPTGTVRIVIDAVAGSPITLSPTATASQTVTGLSVGPHTISCNYSGDNFYAASSCANVVVTVAQASTTSLMSATNNNQPQFTPVTLTANVISNTSGVPTGMVTFYASGTAVGTSSLNPAGVATLLLSRTLDTNGAVTSNNTLLPGTYTLTCTYNGSANFAVSNCPGISFTVLPQVAAFSLVARGCGYLALIPVGGSAPGQGVGCNTGTEITTNGVPTVGTAQGSTTDATLFVDISNTVAGTLTFGCTGLPTYSVCTFSPTSQTVTASTNTALPVYTDVTLWTDIQPGTVPTTSSLGWPAALLGLIALLTLGRKRRALKVLAALLVMVGSTLAFTGCAGPGLYVPVLTPPGTYAVTVTVTGGGITKSAIVNFKVAPGVAGQE